MGFGRADTQRLWGHPGGGAMEGGVAGGIPPHKGGRSRPTVPKGEGGGKGAVDGNGMAEGVGG